MAPPSPAGLFFWSDHALAVAKDVNALAASINPVPMQILSFQHIWRAGVGGFRMPNVGVRKQTGRAWRLCVRVAGFRPVANRTFR